MRRWELAEGQRVHRKTGEGEEAFQKAAQRNLQNWGENVENV